MRRIKVALGFVLSTNSSGLFPPLFLDGAVPLYKVHRVIQLSLCRLIDLKSDIGFLLRFLIIPPLSCTHVVPPAVWFVVKNTFKLAGPQKTIMVSAKTADEKNNWMRAIHDQLEEVCMMFIFR